MNGPATLQHGVVVQGEDAAVYVHVDDFGIQAARDHVANDRAELIQKDSLATGLPAKRKPVGTIDQYIGLKPVARPPSWEPTATKLGAVELAIIQLLETY